MPSTHTSRRPGAAFGACLLALGACAPTPASTTAPTTAKTGSTAAPPPAGAPTRAYPRNEDWWPHQLDLRPLADNAARDDGAAYGAAFETLDLDAVKADIAKLLTTSQPWWPADYGHYGGLMIRLAWHSAGTYRAADGHGGAAEGTIRFAPLSSWPDNANLDKARRLLWPIKRKYGERLSWADLMVLAGNVALESMGFRTMGFGGGRQDVFAPPEIDWGPERTWLASERFHGRDASSLRKPLGATQMGLIYVNPEGPGGNADPRAAAEHIRVAFGRMGMDDEETVALIAGGHTLGKAHGAHKPSECIGPEPEAAPIEDQGLGWKNRCGTGNGADTVTSGLEGAWTRTPARWSHDFFRHLFEQQWELVTGPGGGKQWAPKGGEATVPDAHDPSKTHKPMMLTTDLALAADPAYRVIAERFYKDPKAFETAFAKAWFKLTHRDMGPHVRLRGKQVPPPQPWQDPVPAVDHPLVGPKEIAALKREILASGVAPSAFVQVAWAAASTYRDSDKRGGANGARVRLAPQKDWAVNQPAELAQVIAALESIAHRFNARARGGTRISLADLIVLAGNAAIEDAARRGGTPIELRFTPGRTDATAEQTDVESFAYLEPAADGFRNYRGDAADRSGPELLVAKADALSLTAAEMTVLVGGLRVLGVNADDTQHGVLTTRPGTLGNDFFVHLLDGDIVWKKAAGLERFEGTSRETGKLAWTATAVDLVFGAHSQLRAIAEVYAADDGNAKFVADFAAAWTKVMELDRFDLAAARRR
ncbi:MAG: catalase/peroxidase HPI [Nannocystaceae bacterium]|nr:catalase/peroxidase HPI [Nannocystaceae bacterium]